MPKVREFLAGKKTYIGAAVLAVFGVWLVLRGQPDLGFYAITTAATFVGLGARVNRHKTEILRAIQSGKELTLNVRAHHDVSSADVAKFLEENKPAIVAALETTTRSEDVPASGLTTSGGETK